MGCEDRGRGCGDKVYLDAFICGAVGAGDDRRQLHDMVAACMLYGVVHIAHIGERS